MILLGITCAFTVSALAILMHIIINRALKTQKLLFFVSLIFLFFLPIYFATYILFSEGDGIQSMVNGLFLYVLLYLNYMACLYYLNRPVTLRILTEFYFAKGHSLAIKELTAKYNFNVMIKTRIDLLADHGFLENTNNDIRLTKKGHRFATILIFLRKIVGVRYYLKQKHL